MSLPIMNFAQNNPSRLLQSIEMSRSPAFLASELLNTQRWCEERRGSTYKVPRTVPVMKSLPLLQASHGSRFAQLSKLSLVLKLLALHLRNSFSTSSVLLWGQSSFKSQRNAWVFTYTLFFWKMNFFIQYILIIVFLPSSPSRSFQLSYSSNFTLSLSLENEQAN